MSRLQRAPEKTTEVHEELEELEDYSPQHPLLAYEPKMNLVRAPDHLQQYVEVNPFEHQFQPAESGITVTFAEEGHPVGTHSVNVKTTDSSNKMGKALAIKYDGDRYAGVSKPAGSYLITFNMTGDRTATTLIVKALKTKLKARWLKERINGEDQEKMKKFNTAFEITISRGVHHVRDQQYEIEFAYKYKLDFAKLKREFNKVKTAGKKCPDSFKTVAYVSDSFKGGRCGYKIRRPVETRWRSWGDCKKDIT